VTALTDDRVGKFDAPIFTDGTSVLYSMASAHYAVPVTGSARFLRCLLRALESGRPVFRVSGHAQRPVRPGPEMKRRLSFKFVLLATPMLAESQNAAATDDARSRRTRPDRVAAAADRIAPPGHRAAAADYCNAAAAAAEPR
jgi:hypothetical protein